MFRVLLGLIATVLIAQERGGVVSGVVVDEITGLPIGGARVGIGLVTELKSSASTKTDLEGKFWLADVRSGRYWIDSSAAGYVKIAGYQLEGPEVDVPASGNAHPVTVRLTPEASIGGLLITDTGAPIISSRIEADPSDIHTTSDELGQFRLDGLPPGEYHLRAWIDNLTRRQQMQVDPLTQKRFGLPQSAGLAAPIHLEKGMHLTGMAFRLTTVPLYSASGTVIDAKTGAALEDGEIEVRLAGAIPPIDARSRQQLRHGMFQFDLLTDGSYEALVFRHPGIMTPAFKFELEVRNSDVTGLRLVLSSGGRISGKVTGQRDPRMTHLLLHSAESQTSANAVIATDGSFLVAGLAPGKWNIGFMGTPGGEPTTIASVWQSGKRLGSGLTVVEGDNPFVEIVLARRFWVIGSVIDQTGRPVEKAVVVFQEADGLHAMETGPDGHYRIGIIGGEFILTAWRKLPTPTIARNCPTARPVLVKEDVSGLDVVLCQ